MQGGFTLWNQQPDPAVQLTAELLDLQAGSATHPVRGSGIFVGGHGDWNGAADGGMVRVRVLRTGEVHADGGIPAGTPDLIPGGVFVISGARLGAGSRAPVPGGCIQRITGRTSTTPGG